MAVATQHSWYPDAETVVELGFWSIVATIVFVFLIVIGALGAGPLRKFAVTPTTVQFTPVTFSAPSTPHTSAPSAREIHEQPQPVRD